MTVSEAAEHLGVSARQVRSLAGGGTLPARRVSSGWLISAPAVWHRASQRSSPGRPPSPSTAWALLGVVQQVVDAPTGTIGADLPVALSTVSDRRLRSRLRSLLTVPADAVTWRRRLLRRAQRRSVWVHPGLLDRLVDDARVWAGGAFALAAAGIGVSAATPDRFYARAGDLAALQADYRFEDEVNGALDLMDVSAAAPLLETVPAGGPVPLAVALADALESSDVRVLAAAERLLQNRRL